MNNIKSTELEKIYNSALSGIPRISKSVDDLANDYLFQSESIEQAAKTLINNQIAKCGTSGFITGLGGLLTLPISIPANISSVLYVQLRMIAAIAKIGEFDPTSDQVQTLAYICLTGSSMMDIIKQSGIKISGKVTQKAIEKIPGKVLTNINQKVGFRLITKAGTTGGINLIKLVPIIGGVIGASIDIGSTKIIANNAYKTFIEGKID